MPDLKKWTELFRSENLDVKIRAARALIQRTDVPLWVLLEILDTLSHEGLGAPTGFRLRSCLDSELPGEMIARLESDAPFIREVACNVLGHVGDPAATPHLLRMIDDPRVGVRRAAGCALAQIKDPAATAELRRQLYAHRDDDANVVRALQWALESLGVDNP